MNTSSDYPAVNNRECLQLAFASVDQQQQALVSEIFLEASVENNNFDPRGLSIYRRNLKATAQRALAITFPTVAQLIGENLFNFSGQKLLISSPPSQGDWAMWGDDFAELLSRLPALQDIPFVADIARLDLFRHKSQRAKDSSVDLDSLQLLATTPLNDLYIVLSSSTHILNSEFPIIEFWQAHQSDGHDKTLFSQQLAQTQIRLMEANVHQNVLVYRTEFKAKLRALSNSENHWLNHINQEVSIGHALDKVDSDFNFTEWLPLAIEQNLISHLTTHN